MFRGYISTHRVDATYSALYAALENVFVHMGDDKGSSAEKIYKMTTVERNLMENFLQARNLGMLLSKSNINPKTGRPTIVDPDTNRPIYISDGIIPQVEAYCSKYAYNKLTPQVFNAIISSLNEKASKPTGNHYVFVVNEKSWGDIQTVLSDFLGQYHTDGTYLYSMKAGDYVQVGARGFDTYRWGGKSYCRQ